MDEKKVEECEHSLDSALKALQNNDLKMTLYHLGKTVGTLKISLESKDVNENRD